MNANILPLFAAITLQIALSFMVMLAEFSMNFKLTPRVLVAQRMAVASAILTPLALILERHTRPKMTFKVFILIIIMSVFEPVLEQNLYYTGMELTTATFTAAICNVLPAVTFIVACIFGFENVAIGTRRGKAKLIGTALAVVGALLMTFYTGSAIPLPWTGKDQDEETKKNEEHIGKGVVMLLTSCLSWSVYKMVQAKLLVLYPAKLSMMALMCVLGTFESTIAALIWEGESMSVWKPNPNVTLLASLYGGCLSAAEYYITGWLGKIKGPVYLSMFSPLKLVITAIISSVAMSEELYVGRVVGAAIIIIGISMVLWGKMRDGEQMSPVDAMEDGVSIYV